MYKPNCSPCGLCGSTLGQALPQMWQMRGGLRPSLPLAQHLRWTAELSSLVAVPVVVVLLEPWWSRAWRMWCFGSHRGSWLKHVLVSASNILVPIAGVSWNPRKDCWGRCFWGCSGVWLCHANWMFSCNVASSGSYYFLLLRFLIFYGNLQHQAPDFTSVSAVFGWYTNYLIYLILHDPLSRSLQVIVICKDVKIIIDWIDRLVNNNYVMICANDT